MYVLKRVVIGPDEICSFIIGDACGDIFNPTHEWDVVFPPVPKPNVAVPKSPTEVASVRNFLNIYKNSYLFTYFIQQNDFAMVVCFH